MEYPFTLIQAGHWLADKYPIAENVDYMEILDFTSSAKDKNKGFARCDRDGTSNQLPREKHVVYLANKDVELAFLGETFEIKHNNIMTKYGIIKRVAINKESGNE